MCEILDLPPPITLQFYLDLGFIDESCTQGELNQRKESMIQECNAKTITRLQLSTALIAHDCLSDPQLRYWYHNFGYPVNAQQIIPGLYLGSVQVPQSEILVKSLQIDAIVTILGNPERYFTPNPNFTIINNILAKIITWNQSSIIATTLLQL